MKFKSENQMVELLIEKLKTHYDRGNIEIFEEVSLGYGVADLVLTQMVKNKEKNLTLEEKTLDSTDINILFLIKSNKEITLEEIIETTKINKSRVNKSIEKLLQKEYIKTLDEKITSYRNYQFPFKANFAIEAKLRDWKKALKQAYRYKWFAEYSYVVLDEKYSKSATNNIYLFKKYNVGLASIDSLGKIKKYFNPIRQNPIDPKMQLLFSEKVKSNLGIS